MDRRKTWSCMTVLGLVVIGLLPGGSAEAGPCDLSCSQVPGVITMSPDGLLAYEITIFCCDTGPVEGARVEIEFGAEASLAIAWPPGEPPSILAAITDHNGLVTFHITGSGCIDFDRFHPTTFIAQVRVDGIVIAEPSVTSPDAVDTQGRIPRWHNICEDGFTSTSLADAVFHTGPIKNATVEPCTKFTGDPDDPISLADAVVITPYIKQGIGTDCVYTER